MTYRINEQTTAALFIGGKEFLLDLGNAMRSMHIRSSSLISLPEAKFTVVDQLNQMPNYGLQDGAQIVLQINGTINLTRKFRVFKWKRYPIGQGFTFEIECYWDSPKYWIGTTNAGFTGSSAQVLQQISAETGLKWNSENDTTSDSMVWMGGNQTYSEFSKDIARHGYISDTSHMGLAIDSLGTMRYVDINKLAKPKLTVGYTPGPSDHQFLMITDFAPKTSSGVNNAVGGYMHSRYVQNVEGSGSSIDTLEDELSFTSDSKFPLLSSDVRSKMGRGSVSFSPVNWGNVHDNYERALYQNARYNLLNSLTGEFVFPFQTNLEPFDNFNLALPAELLSTQYNGEYTIHSKIIFVQGSSYNEKIIAVKNGLGS